MRTRFLTLTTALLAACCSNAHALSIGGWGVSINSPLHVTVDLRGVPNPYTQPTITKVQATLDQLEYYCFNPQNYSVAPGKAGQLTVSGADQVKAEDILGKGQATVDFIFPIDDNLQCVNPLWNYLEGSAAAKIVTVNIDYYFCSGDVKTDPDPCFDGEELTIEEKKAATTVSGVCTLNPVERDKDYVPISGQVYDCVQTSP
jgi:hypothetical protein